MQESKKEAAPASVATTDQSQERTNQCPNDHYTEDQIIGQILVLLNRVNQARDERGCGYMFEANAIFVSLSYNLIEDPNDENTWTVHFIVKDYMGEHIGNFAESCLKVYDALLKIADMRGVNV